MGKTNKRKRAFRVRQKIAQRSPSKISQMKQLMHELETMEDRAKAGLPLYPQIEKEH